MRNLSIAVLTAFVLASCRDATTPSTAAVSSSPTARATSQALLITDLTLDAGVIGNTVSYQATLPVATVVGTVAQTLEATWNASIHNLNAPPIVPQGWSLNYYAGGTLLGAQPTTTAGWNSVTRVTSTGAVTADGVDGERQALLSSISAPPVVIPASFSGGSAGDGWDVFFDPGHTRVYNVHHHNGPATLMCRKLADSTTCPGYPMALSNTPSRATGRFDATSMKIWLPTSNSGFLAWDCADANTGTRCATPVVRSTLQQRDTGYDNHGDPAIIGRKMYALGRTPTTSVITCLDMSTGTECTGATLPLNGQFNDASLTAIDNRLYVIPGTNLGIDCYDSTTMMRCPGTWPVAAARGTVWGVPNADGSITNFCSNARCYALDGTATTLPPNFVAYLAANPVVALSYTGIQYGKATSFANKAAWTITGNRAACWDMATDAKCAAAFPIAVTSMYAPTFDPEDSDCLWTNADTGIIQNWRVSTGGAGCSGGPPKISFKAAISIPRLGCDPSSRVWQYKSFKLTTPSAAQYTSATLTVKNSFGAAIAGWTNIAIPSATTTVDLTALPTALAGSTPTFEVAANGFTDTTITPAADFRVTTGATPQLCWSLAGPPSTCPTTAGLADLNPGTTQVTNVTAKGSYTVTGQGTTDYTDQVSPATVPDTTPYIGNCGGNLQVTARNADSSAAAGVVIALLDSAGNPVLSGGTAVTATTDATGAASFGVWANVGYKLKMVTMPRYSPASMTVISGGLGVTTASGGTVTSNTVTPPLAGTGSVFVSVNLLAPAPPVILSPVGGTTSAQPLIQGTCVTAATVTVFEGATSLCTAVCSASTFSCRSSSLADGPHTIFASQSDVHGDSNPSGNQSFTVQTLVLAVSPGTAVYDALGSPTVLDPALGLTGSGTLAGATVTIGTGFEFGDQLNFTAQNGITGSYNANRGVLTLTGTATPAQYQAALASVTYSSNNGATPSTALRTITFALGTGISYQANSHFYEYISGGSWTWLQAQSAAASRSYFGLQGYLVTVTDAAENAYVSSKLQGAGWMGASAPVGQGYPRAWSWMTGPEAGQAFCNNTSAGVCSPISGAYTDWNGGEPNNSGNAEPRAQFLANGLWNDLPDNYALPGYVVEYGGIPGEPPLSITGSRNLSVRQAAVITVSPTPSNGTVSCQSPVLAGTDSVCTITPAISYRLSALTDNGVDVLASVSNGTYTIVAATSAHTISATFVYVPPVLTVSSGTVGYDALGSPVVVDSALSLVGPGTITGATVTIGAGFSVGDVLTFVNQNGITGSYDANKGLLTLTGTASVADYQTALASVTYSNTAGATPPTALRTLTFAVGTAVSYQANSHFYEYISGGSLTWQQARTAAAARSYYGLQGYLATITDGAENAYVSSKLRGAGWMGATSTSTAGLPSFPRTWTWATGPEAGTDFCENTASGSCTPIASGYVSWNNGEPNNAGNEYRAQFLANGLWNDLSDTAVLPGYVVEYGGMAGDPSLSITGSRSLQVRAATSVVVSSTANPSEWAQDVTFRATFTPAASTGLAQFQIDGTDFGAPSAIVAGVATSGTISILTIGAHVVTVSYAGDVERQPATGSLSGGQHVTKASNGHGLCSTSNEVDVCVSGVCDPDGKCGYANNVGPCTAGNAGTVCRTGVCDPDGKCGYADGDGTCTAGAPTPTCRSGFCGVLSGICRANAPNGCGDDRDCNASQYCDGNTFTCLPKVPVSMPLPNDPRHNAGVCTTAVGAAVCVGGACETGDNLCGTSNNHACSTNANCRSGVCGADGFCGVPNGGACTVSTACRTGSCSPGGTCGLPNGSSCTNGAACLSGVCGADGTCGIPNGGACTSNADCRAGVCSADGRCGVPNGGSCTSGDSCRAGACDASGRCSSTCTTTAQCGQGLFCSPAGACVPAQPNGASCTAASQCASNICSADGKCGSDTGGACTAASDCRAGACNNGVCSAACTADAQCARGFFCGAGGSCTAAQPNGGTCSAAAQCQSGICNPDGKCGQGNGAPCAGASDCRSGICNAANTCAATCANNRECLSGNYCDATSHACVPVQPNGGTCSTDSMCTSAVCDTDGVCGGANGRPCGQPANCRSAVCSTDGRCGDVNDVPCLTPDTCRANICDVDGKCGGEPGTACTTDAACRDGVCGADGKCGEPNGTPCVTASTCRSGACAPDGLCGDNLGATCASATTCRTGSCVSGACSLRCSVDGDCASGSFCDSSTNLCHATLDNGQPCNRAGQCAAGLCAADGQCGAARGDSCSSPSQCRDAACAAGTCDACTSDSECTASTFCSNGACAPRRDNGSACSSAGQCQSNVCVAGVCGVPATQPCSSPTQCRSGICDDVSGGCATTCASNAQCGTGTFCDQASHQCLPSAPNSSPPHQPCTTASQCSSGVCGLDGICGVPDGGQCVTGASCRGGACVNGSCASACTTDSQCGASSYCDSTGTCSAKILSGGSCAKPSACVSGTCAADGRCGTLNGGACTAPVQCRASACSNGTCGSSCASDNECQSGNFCDSGSCAPKRAGGSQCTAAGQCAANVCAADGRCGKTSGEACAAASQCRSDVCSAGICAAACVADADCPTGDTCSASHQCLPRGSNGTGGARSCATSADCTSGVCATDGRCGFPTGGGSCNPVNATTMCRSAACSDTTGTCVPGGGRGCSTDADCTASAYCDAPSLTCVPKLAAGRRLPTDTLHQGGRCTVSTGAAVCLGGVCDPADDTCGLPNARACTVDTQCRSGSCNADGFCGVPNGGACTQAQACRSGACVNGACGQPNGGSCQAATECVSGVCTAGTCGIPNGGRCVSDAVCQSLVCDADGFCGAPVGGACANGDTCRSGTCVNHACTTTCSADAQCATGLSCQSGQCSPKLPNGATCTAASQCASAVCGADGKCGADTGGQCTSAATCRSGICASGTCSAMCTVDANCQGGDLCVNGACVAKSPAGAACTSDSQCANDRCVNGTCGAPNGQACTSPPACASGICDPTGTCAANCAHDADCSNGTYCNAQHQCVPSTGNGTSCATAAQCTSGVCEADGTCGYANGGGACTGQNAATLCRSGSCGTASNTCVPSGGCTVDRDCLAGNFCVPSTKACVATLASGQPIPTDALHNHGVCTKAIGAIVCAAGTCDSQDNLCGTPNDGACTANTQCRGGACGADGRCGTPNGTTCTTDASCRSGVCDADGKCGSNTGECTASADCRSGICSPADNRCGLPGGTSCTSNSECRGGVCAADGHCGADLGGSCASGDACRSGACVNGQCSATCTTDATCGAGTTCTNGSCTSQHGNGESCSRNGQCRSGVCGSDGKCGGTTGATCASAADCRVACSNGVCGSSCSANSDCAQGTFCQATACVPTLADGAACTVGAQCRAGVCGSDGLCGATTGAACVTPQNCRTGICDSTGTCSSVCGTSRDCATGTTCDAATHACVKVSGSGTACSTNASCSSGVCGSNGVCGGAQGDVCGASSQCQSGVCDPSDLRCGLNNGSAGCTADTAAQVCRSGVCVNGTCGLQDGAVCTADSECASGSCSEARVCAAKGSNPGLALKGGSGCSTTPGTVGVWGVLALLGLVLRRRRHAAKAVVTLAVLVVGGSSFGQTALVQGFAAQNFDSSYAGDAFFASPQATTTGHLLPAAKLTLNYANQPVRITSSTTGQIIPSGVVVRDQLYLHLDLSLAVIDRLRIDVGVPMALAQTGDPQSAGASGVHGGRLGDLRLGLRGSLYGAPTDVFAFGLQGDLVLPTGSVADFTGAGSTRGHLRAIASGTSGRFLYSGALGVMLASHRELGLSDVGSSLTYSAGAAMRFFDDTFQVGPELFGSTVLASGTTPLEVLLGAKYRWNGFVFGGGIGAGLSGAPSAATVRGLLSIAWEPAPPPPPAPAVVCPAPPPPADVSASRDSDHDGVADKLDACQFVAGVASEDAAKNGCPADADGDGVADASDACPAAAGLASNNGCPPAVDRDGDGVYDSEDLCPDVRGAMDGAKKGCPAETAELKEAHIELAEQVRFANDKAALLPVSEDVLRSVASVMKAHPEIARVSIEGFTDNRGPAAYNQQLSADRAASVLEWLAKTGGIDRKRMVSKGYGSDKAIASNDDEAGRQRNRRVEVRILEYKAQ